MGEESLFLAALDLPTAADRAAFLAAECGSDAGLRARVERLLAADDRSTGILDAAPDTAGPAANPYRPGPGLAAGHEVAGRFRLVRKLGEGGMGEVWEADQTLPVRRPVALKVIRPGLDPAALLARFDQERQALALMDHPHIARVFDAGVADGLPFLAMELVDGAPITRYCDARRLTVRQRLGLFVPVCRAVQHAHQKGVIHRDLKPSNVLVAEADGEPVPKVIDFGIAKAAGGKLTDSTVRTGYGAILGTPEYMAPEQAAGEADVDTRADVYALGVILYELLTGTTPIRRTEAGGLLDLLRAIREDEPPAPSRRLADLRAARTEAGPAAARHPRELDWVVMRCLEKDRNRRYESAAALARDIERFLADEVVEARPPTAGYRVRKFVARNRAAVVAAGLVLLALVGGVVGTSWGLVRADEARRAEADRADGERRARALVDKGFGLVTAVYADLDPRSEGQDGRPLRAVLGERLAKAADELDGLDGDPAVMAGLRDRLGKSLVNLGFAARAVPLFERALADRTAALGPDHPDTLRSQNNLAWGHLNGGRPEAAVPLLEDCLPRVRGPSGPDHPDALTVLNNLAWAYQDTDRAGEAVGLYERCLRARRAALGPDHPDTLGTLNNLALAYAAVGRPAEAVELLERRRGGLPGRFGSDHPDALAALNNLAFTLHEAGRAADAIPLYEDCLRRTRAKHGPAHPVAVATLGNLADAYLAAGRGPEALPLLAEVVPLRRRELGADSPLFALVLARVANALVAAGQFAAAEPYIRESLAVREKVEPDDWGTFNARSLLGASLLGLGKFAEAEPYLLGGYAGLKERELTMPVRVGVIPVRSARLADAADRLVELYEAVGKPDEAAKWRAERATYPFVAPPPRPAR